MINIYKKILILYMLSNVVACSDSFQPAPYTSDQWKQANKSYLDVEEAMLECGYPSYAGAGRGTPENEIAAMQLCMESKGYRYTNRLGTFCNSYPSLPACVAAAEEKAAMKNSAKKR